MNIEDYLATEQVRVDLNSEVRGLDGKSIVIIDSQKREIRARLRLAFETDPNRADTRKCSVIVWRDQVDERGWADAPLSQRPTLEAASWERFLTAEALAFIRKNDGDPMQGELKLILPVPLG